MKKHFIAKVILIVTMASLLTACTGVNEAGILAQTLPMDITEEGTVVTVDGEVVQTGASYIRNDIGGLSPEQALDYMKDTEDLVIVDVSARSVYEKEHIDGAVHVYAHRMDIRNDRIAEGAAVILYDADGSLAPVAYEVLRELREDLTEISYIAGEPLIHDYNVWALINN